MPRLKLTATSSEKYTRHPNQEDGWDTGDTSTDWFFGNEITTEGDYGTTIDSEYGLVPESLTLNDLKEGQTYRAHVVVVNTGHSFGLQDNCYAYLIAVTPVSVKKVDHETLGGLKPWDGYFESLSYTKTVLATFTG